MSEIRGAEWIALRDANMLRWMAGNQEAVDAVHTITSICDVWDDLVDRDKEVSEQEINRAFARALIDLPTNPFYRKHQDAFLGLIVTGANAWLDANVLQKSSVEKWRMLAFYIRTFGFEVAHLAAFHAGGWDHLRSVSLDMRSFFEGETYSEWEHRHGME